MTQPQPRGIQFREPPIFERGTPGELQSLLVIGGAADPVAINWPRMHQLMEPRCAEAPEFEVAEFETIVVHVAIS